VVCRKGDSDRELIDRDEVDCRGEGRMFAAMLLTETDGSSLMISRHSSESGHFAGQNDESESKSQ